MNDEIKEIIKETKKIVDNSDYKNCYNYHIFFKVEHIAKLLDYITNLQQENERLIKELENISLDEASIRADVLLEQQDYKSRCEKAVEYLKQTSGNYRDLHYEPIKVITLINILNGRSDK